MVFTLQRYIFRELFRVFVLATIALTLILSLGGILGPVQEYGVGPKQVLHILVYFMPVTLTFVLPMAALFASALTFGRFADDNELDACRASGLSLATLIYPGLALAVLVAIANLLLSFHVMPYFVHLAERSLKADAKQILFRNIQRRGFYALPPEREYVIYADHADLKNDALFGIVVVESADEGIQRLITSELATVRFDLHDRFNEVQLTVYNFRMMGAADDYWVELELSSLKRPFGSLLGDDIKFKRIGEMKRIRSDLMLFDPIARLARQARRQLATEMLARDIALALAADEHGSFQLAGDTGPIRLWATGCRLSRNLTVELLPPVVVQEYTATGEQARRLSCEEAEIRLDENASPLRLVLDLANARVAGTGQLVVRDFIGDLHLPASIRTQLAGVDPLSAVMPERAEGLLGAPPSSTLAGLQKSLIRLIRTTLVDIQGEINSRLVFGIGCIPMILIGIGLGIIKREGHLLSAFGASCLPAAVLVVAIISGKQVTKNVGAQAFSGVLIMWGGLAFLVLVTTVIYGRLLRH
jgi:lipopolysaccharide export LptBFGC system permease protein LptF